MALGNSGDQTAVPSLIGALRQCEPLVRGHAAWALGRLGGEESRKALWSALAGEGDADVRREIEMALAELAEGHPLLRAPAPATRT